MQLFNNYVNLIASVCESKFSLASLTLGQSYYYDSLPHCIVDAVFSIGVRYTSTQNTVSSFCRYCHLREYNPNCDTKGDQFTVSQMITVLEKNDADYNASTIFQNYQRTSSRGGILKAEAVLYFAQILQKYGIETIADFRQKGLPNQAEVEFRKIPGQKSGLSIRYFCMLAGDDSYAKPDRHILRFIKQYTGQCFTVNQAQQLLKDVVEHLKSQYHHLTVRLLDYAIWNDMVHTNKPTNMHHMHVQDRIPKNIEISGKRYTSEILSNRKDLDMLNRKLTEVVAEYQQDQSLEKLAQLLEVLQVIVTARGWTMEQLEQIQAEKPPTEASL